MKLEISSQPKTLLVPINYQLPITNLRSQYAVYLFEKILQFVNKYRQVSLSNETAIHHRRLNPPTQRDNNRKTINSDRLSLKELFFVVIIYFPGINLCI